MDAMTDLALQSGLMAQMLIALGRNTAVPLVNMAAMAATVLADIAVIPRFGMAGAAWVAVAAQGGGYLLLALCTHRAGIPVRAWNCLKPAALLLLSALPLYYGNDSLVGRLAAPALFTLLCLAFGVVTPGQMKAVARAMLPGGRGVSEDARPENGSDRL